MSKNYNHEIGYESLLADFKRYQKRTPTGITLVRKNQHIYLQFKTTNTTRKQYSCNCAFTIDGISEAYKKACKVSEALRRFPRETELWEWYDKKIKNTSDRDYPSLG